MGNLAQPTPHGSGQAPGIFPHAIAKNRLVAARRQVPFGMRVSVGRYGRTRATNTSWAAEGPPGTPSLQTYRLKSVCYTAPRPACSRLRRDDRDRARVDLRRTRAGEASQSREAGEFVPS